MCVLNVVGCCGILRGIVPVCEKLPVGKEFPDTGARLGFTLRPRIGISENIVWLKKEQPKA